MSTPVVVTCFLHVSGGGRQVPFLISAPSVAPKTGRAQSGCTYAVACLCDVLAQWLPSVLAAHPALARSLGWQQDTEGARIVSMQIGHWRCWRDRWAGVCAQWAWSCPRSLGDPSA